MRTMLAFLMLSTVAVPAAAQSFVPPPPKVVGLSGPRFGITSLSPGVIEKLAERDIAVRPMISQFGWQFERQFTSRGSGLTAISEWVVLFGGLEQNVALPSLTWLVGLRSSQGAEFGIGPNITPAGTALALAAGVTFRVGAMNVPMNFAVVPSQSGVRVSILSGFTFRR
ncbi:MAG TPA: hypothetical protein VMM93_03525 [Vicinamibacterales bacterium]|nr:hypothetical protein [Vicinamibacterales bacterium]